MDCALPPSPADITPSTPVSRTHLSTSGKNCMFPFANTGMDTLRLEGKGGGGGGGGGVEIEH